MPLLRRNGTGSNVLTPQPYDSERELQEVIEAHPELVMADDELGVAVVASEFVLPSGAGRLDLLLVDAAGCPTAVEVKLRRNGESRREVIAQVFDYVSALAELRVTELDQSTGHGVDGGLRRLLTDDNEDAYETAWLACDASLRAGTPRVVVAVDSAPDDLTRIVRFMNEHSDLDVRLVQIQKFAAADETIFVPTFVVRGAEEGGGERRGRSTSPVLLAAVDAFQSRSADVSVHGRARHYRQIKVAGWPASLHYEFLCAGDSVAPELHLESQEVMEVAGRVEGLADKVRAAIPEADVSWVTPWQRVGGRLRVARQGGFDAQAAAEAMSKLIEVTRGPVEEALREAGIG